MNRDKAREAAIRQLLLDYNCRFTCEVDDKLTGLNLMDKLCAPDAEDISTGREEIEALAEYLDDNLPVQSREDVASAWVPIRSVDDLPKENGEYIWQRKDGRIGAGHYHTALHKDEIVAQCVAWHRLPPPYQEDKDDIEEKIRKVTERGDAITGDEFERERR